MCIIILHTYIQLINTNIIYKKIQKYMIYCENTEYISVITLRRAIKAENELCIHIDTTQLIVFFILHR